MYIDLLTKYYNNLNALMDYVTAIKPIAESTFENKITRKEIKNFTFNSYVEFLSYDNWEKVILESEISDAHKEKLIREINATQDSLEQLGVSIDDLKKGNMYTNKMPNLNAYLKMEKIIYGGSLILSVIYFENLFSDLFRDDFSKYPVLLEKKEVSYKVVIQSENLKDIKDILIDSEVTNLMYKSFDDWIDYLKKRKKVQFCFLEEILLEIKEIIARRNVQVHNDGKVNSIYLSIVKNSSQTLQKNQELQVNEEYIINAIKKLELAGICIIIELAIKEDKANISAIMDFIYNFYLVDERWDISLDLYKLLTDLDSFDTIVDSLLCKINMWLCFKRLGRYGEIEANIRALDLSACDKKYLLAKYALLDDKENFFAEFDITNEDLRSLMEMPVFLDLKNTEDYQIMVDSISYDEVAATEA